MNSRFSTCKFLGLLLAAGLVSGQAIADDTNSASATVNAEILIPITIANTDMQGISFGNIIFFGDAGTVTLSPLSVATRAPSNTNFLTGTGAGTVTAAKFTVSGEPDAAYSVTLPTDLTLNSGTSADTMSVDEFTSLNAAEGTVGTLSEAGSELFYVGATLNVGATQASGTYSGSFDVTVNYN